MKTTRKGFLKAVAGGGLLPVLGAAELKTQKISEIQFYPFFLESKDVMRIAFATMAAADVLVRVRTNDGIIGWGDASPFAPVTGDTQETAVVMGKKLAEVVRNRNPFEVPRILDDMDKTLAGQPSIKAAIEMALWDICGKVAGQPVYRLLGQFRDSFETDCTVYLDEPQSMAEKARAVVDRGFRIIKVKLGETPEKDMERMRAVRAALGRDIRIRIDANQGWSPADAVRALRGLEQFQLEFCEQPVSASDWAGMGFVRQHVGIPIMADEAVHSAADAIEAARTQATDMINIKLMKAGGILPSARIAEIAAAANMKCMLGCMSETRIALTAAAHVAFSQRAVQYADLDAFTEHKTDPVIGGMKVQGGVVTLPEAPGLGLDVNPAFLKDLRAA